MAHTSRFAHVQRHAAGDHLAVRTNAGPSVSVGLVRYFRDIHQPPHYHEYTALSLLLAGSLQEVVSRRTHVMHGTAWAFKPPGCLHSDTWAAHGGLIFSIKVAGAAPELEGQFSVGWEAVCLSPEFVTILRTCLLNESPEVRAEALADILSSADRSPLTEGGGAPTWLRRIRDEMCDCPTGSNVASAAEAAGVHRSHVTRLFKRHYGMAPSAYRKRIRIARAVAALAESSSSLSAIAADIGFSDQPHMTRFVAKGTGFTPSTFRRLFGDIYSRSVGG